MPSAKILDQKKAKVEQLTELLKNSCAGVLVDYKGVTVEEDTKLRRELRDAGIHYTVEKNSMLRFALKNAGLEAMEDVLEGTTALAVSEHDQTAAARILGKFAETCGDNKFFMKKGFVDGEIYDAAKLEALSKIPSKDVLLAQLVGSLLGPMTSLAAMVKAVSDKKAAEENA